MTGAELESCEPSYTGLDTLTDYAGVFRQADNLSARSIADHLKRTVTALLLTRSIDANYCGSDANMSCTGVSSCLDGSQSIYNQTS